jgi:hypothetical protein
MALHGLSRTEMVWVVRVCRHFRVGKQFPKVLQEFISQQLRPTFPETAQKVDQLNAEQMRKLIDEIRLRQIVMSESDSESHHSADI